MHQVAEPAAGSSELALAHAWANGNCPTGLSSRDGTHVEIVYRGVWTHGFGPDFAEAMIAWPNGVLETGAIELHLRTSGWREHGHHVDPAYDNVILHVVGLDDGSETRRSDGKLVPVVAIGLDLASTPEGADWSRVGGDVCAAELAANNPGEIVAALRALGDARLATHVAAFESELTHSPPDQVLWSGLLDALGISENRDPMRAIGALVPIVDLERLVARSNDRFETAAACLFGAGGFIPLSPRDAEATGLDIETIAAIETTWQRRTLLPSAGLSPGAWRTARVRPANHPLARLTSAAGIVAACPDGIGNTLVTAIREGEFQPADLVEMTARYGAGLGADRSIVLTSRVLIPFAIARSEQSGDTDLADGAMAIWDSLAASAHNRQSRAAQLQVSGGPPLRGLGERGMQGLIQLHRTRCQPRRCFECPIAAMVILGIRSS